MFVSYFKKFPEKNMQLEVIVETLDDSNEGNVIDVKKHPLEYEPNGTIIWDKTSEA